MNYTKLLERLKDSPIKLENSPPSQVSTGLKMVNHYHPWSITQDEFNHITKTIVDRNLKNGFEVATAFGISALAAGLGFKETGGKLVTLDAYIEEYYNNCGVYKDKHNECYQDADGWKSMQYIIEVFELQDVITPVVGWSPDDICKHVEGYLDYAFIDGGHWTDQVLADTREVKKYLGDKASVFFHDGQCLPADIRAELGNIIGGSYRDVCGMPSCWELGVVEI